VDIAANATAQPTLTISAAGTVIPPNVGPLAVHNRES
jgi:hypothetical protein